ncbi:MAG: Na+/H+ antiporter NhaC family protein, partial [Bacteroidaceae bacterium]|nr:Na+/H+ antiporter NhaC family protein [Bacteroidaceae bacterium]
MKCNWFSLSPLLVFLVLYLVTSIIVNDFYKVPITVAFVVSSIYAVCITRDLTLTQRIEQFSKGAANPGMMLMIWIFILAGAFAQSAKAMGAVDATVNLTLQFLPESMLLPGLFLASCFISLSIGTSVGTVVALTPMAVGVASQTGVNLPMIVAIVVGGAFFGDNLSFISDTTIVAT